MSDENTYWLKPAAFISIMPSIGIYSLFFSTASYKNSPYEKKWQHGVPEMYPSNANFAIPYYIAASILMLLTLPLDLLIGLIALPIATVHDLFVGIGEFFCPQPEEKAM